MGFFVAKLFEPNQVDTSVETLFTVPSTPPNIKLKITSLTFTNTSNATVTVTVYLVPLGGSAGDSNTVRKTKAILPLDVWECFEARHTLKAGDFVQAVASSATSVTAMGSGVEVT